MTEHNKGQYIIIPRTPQESSLPSSYCHGDICDITGGPCCGGFLVGKKHCMPGRDAGRRPDVESWRLSSSGGPARGLRRAYCSYSGRVMVNDIVKFGIWS